MINASLDSQANVSREWYESLLAVSQAIVTNRDLPALLHAMGGHLRQIVRFDYLSLVLHEPATNTMRLQVLESAEPIPDDFVLVLPVEDDPAGLVWQAQEPLIIATMNELARWPALLERVTEDDFSVHNETPALRPV